MDFKIVLAPLEIISRISKTLIALYRVIEKNSIGCIIDDGSEKMQFKNNYLRDSNT